MTDDNLKTWPELIYLQAGDDGEGLPTYKEAKEDCITWCADSVVDYEVKYIRADLLDQANATIAELKKSFRKSNLELLDVISDKNEQINETMGIEIERNTLKIALSKLRATVPEDVARKLGEIEVTCCIGGMNGAAPFTLEQERKDLLAMIGTLIERSREERKREIVEAYKAGWDESFGKLEDKSEAYAERILGEGK